MKYFTFSDLNRQSGEVLDAAMAEPVVLKKRGKDKLIIMSVDQYRKLARSHQTAYTLKDAPQDVHDELMAGLEDILRENGDA